MGLVIIGVVIGFIGTVLKSFNLCCSDVMTLIDIFQHVMHYIFVLQYRTKTIPQLFETLPVCKLD